MVPILSIRRGLASIYHSRRYLSSSGIDIEREVLYHFVAPARGLEVPVFLGNHGRNGCAR